MHLNSSIIAKAVDGDRSARDRLLSICRPLLKIAAGQECRDRFQSRFDESDIVQLTCLEADRALADFRGRTSAEMVAWLSTILQRTLGRLRDEHTAQRRDIRREVSRNAGQDSLSFVWNAISESSAGPASRVIIGEAAVAVAFALDQLPQHYKVALRMRFIDGMKIQDIAEECGSTLGTVAGNLRRGLAMLHDRLPVHIAEELQP